MFYLYILKLIAFIVLSIYITRRWPHTVTYYIRGWIFVKGLLFPPVVAFITSGLVAMVLERVFSFQAIEFGSTLCITLICCWALVYYIFGILYIKSALKYEMERSREYSMA